MSGTERIRQQLEEFIRQKFALARKRGIAPEDPLLETGIVDSLGMLEFVNFLEKEFAIHLEDDDLTPENFQTINSIAAFVGKKRTAAAREAPQARTI